MHTSDRWWQRAVLVYFVLIIQIGTVLDEDLHHLQMAFRCGVHQRGPSPLSETDTHSERNTTACNHTLPTSYRQLSIYKHTYIHSYSMHIQRLLRIHMLLHTYIHTYIHKYIHTYIHTYSMGIHTDCAYRDTSL
jgi:hypothetical protein